MLPYFFDSIVRVANILNQKRGFRVKTIRRLLGETLIYRKWLAIGFASMLVVVAMNMAVPWFIRWIIDLAIVEGNYHLLVPYSASIVGITLIKGLFMFLERYSMVYMAQRVIYDFRNRLYDHLQHLPFGFYDQSRTGELMSRATQDVETLRRFLGFGIIHVCQNILMFIGVVTFMAMVHPVLTLIALGTMPFLIWTIKQFSGKVRPAYMRVQEQLAQLTSVLQENVSGMRVVRAFAQEDHEIEKFRKENWDYLEKNITTVRYWAFYFPLMNFISAVGTAGVIWYGGREVIAGNLTIGALVAFNSYLMMFLIPMRMLGWLINLTNRSIASGDRIYEILDTRAEVLEPPGAEDLPPAEGRVAFEDVSFAYPGSDSSVLRGVNLVAEPGQVVALLGGSGSGKSTLVNLIPRFYDPDQGRVTVDGTDIREVTLASLRKQIGIVAQETFLFSASIGENIAYGSTKATAQQIEEAARAARIHDFIISLPRGYDTLVGERGVGLSGGQKQRVAIARALLVDPRILILDEATSSVDTETEYLIQEALRTLMKGRTTFVIAQRLSTVKSADQILVLDQGRVVQRGRHPDLVEEPGIYREIYELQLRSQEAAGEEG